MQNIYNILIEALGLPEIFAASNNDTASYSGWINIVPMVFIFLIFYFLLIRPQEKRRKKQEELINSIKIGEEIVTTGGIFGVVTKLDTVNNTIEIKISNTAEVKLLKSAVLDVVSRK